MPQIPSGLVNAIREFPARHQVEPCGVRFDVPVLDIYGRCPQCGTTIKHRSYSAGEELEELFDAAAEWMLKPGARETFERRIAEIRDDLDE